MSSSIPPQGPGQPEYLEQGSGAPLGAGRPSSGNRRTVLLAGGAVAGLLLVGGGVWAAMSFLGQGPQPAEALPASTLGYASVDLDPSGGQKIEAIQMLRKFPAFKDEIGLDTDDDVREKIFDEVGIEEQCDGLDYADDVEPWLGDRFAVAAIDLGEDEPTIAGVIQVKDEAKAEEGLAALMECGGDEETAGWSVDGEWAVVAETDAIAEQIADETSRASLADDGDFQQWTDEVGDAGVVNMYAAPAAGAYLADHADDLFGSMMGTADYSMACEAQPATTGGDGEDVCEDVVGMPDEMSDDSVSEIPEELRQTLEEFGGMAMTVRFDDGAVELEVAGDAAATQQGLPVTEGADDVLATLPDDTALAVGLGFADGWFSGWMDQMVAFSGGQMTVDDLIAEAEEATGLELPEDAETLVGDSAAFAISADIDPEAFVNSETAEGLPLGVKVHGDPEAIEAVLDRLRSRLGPDAEFLVSKSADDTIAIGVDDDYVAELLEDGDLGDTDAFQNVVREAEDASSIFFLNFDAGDGWLVKVAEDDEEVADNLEPLEGLGMSGWVEGDAGHVVLRLTTD